MGLSEYGDFEVIYLVIHVTQDREEAVNEGIQNAVEQELLAVEHAAAQLLTLLVKQRQGAAVDRDEILATDEQVHLA